MSVDKLNDQLKQTRYKAYNYITCMLCCASSIGYSFAQATIVNVTAKRPPIDVVSISKDSIETQQLDRLDQVLEQLPGVNISSNGWRSKSSVFIRAGNSDHTFATIDGIEVNDITSPAAAFDPTRVGTEGAASVSVQKGPMSGENDADGLAGSIAITTEKGQGPFTLETVAETGSFSTHNLQAALKGSKDKADVHIKLLYDKSDGICVRPAELRELARQHKPDGYKRYGFISRTGYEISDTLHLHLFAHVHEHTNAYAEPYRLSNPSMLSHKVTQLYNVMTTLKYAHYEGAFSVGTYLLKRTSKNEEAPFGSIAEKQGNTFQVLNQNKWAIAKEWHVLANVKYNHKTFKSLEAASPQHPLTTQQSHDSNISKFSLGVKGKICSWLKGETWLKKQLVSGYSAPLTPQFSLEATSKPMKAAFLFSYAMASKPPSSYQRFDHSVGNNQLKSELTKSWQFSWIQNIPNWNLQTQITYFEQTFTDLIEYEAKPNNAYGQYVNINKADSHGIETSATWKANEKIRLQTSWTYLYAYQNSKRLANRPIHKFSLQCNWQLLENFNIGAGLIRHGKELNVDEALSKENNAQIIYSAKKGKTLVRLYVNYTPQTLPSLTLFARIENLTNVKSQSPIGYMNPGISFMTGIKYSLS